jgi:hypothetical protein
MIAIILPIAPRRNDVISFIGIVSEKDLSSILSNIYLSHALAANRNCSSDVIL